MIDNIYILNGIAYEAHRIKCKNKLLDAGVPENKIKVWTAKYHNPYGKSRDLCEAAAQDGFPFFQKLLDLGKHNTAFIGYLAQTWSYLCFMRHIVENNETSILMHDKYQLRCTFDELDNACGQLPYQKYFMYASLACVTGKIYQEPQWVNKKSVFGKGLIPDQSMDWAMLYSPKGAAFLLNHLEQIVQNVNNGWFGSLVWSDKTITEHKHVFSLCVNPTPDNVKNIVNIQKAFKDNLTNRDLNTFGFYQYIAIDGIPGITTTLHNKKGQWIRPLESTRD